MLDRFDRVLAASEEALVAAAGVVVLALMLVVSADVVSRALFNRPLQNSYEYMALGMVAIVYLGIASVQRLGEHISIDAATRALPFRARAALDVVGCLFGLVMLGAIGWWGALLAWESFATGEYVGSVARLPMWPARTALVIGCVFACLRLIIDVIRHLQAIGRPSAADVASI